MTTATLLCRLAAACASAATLLLALAACGSDDETGIDPDPTGGGGTGGVGLTGGGGTGGVGLTGGGGTGGVDPCPRVPAAADRVRKVVISHPYDSGGGGSPRFEVLDLSETGELSQTGQTFELGRTTETQIAFTPDGKVGIVAEEDGSLGVFGIDEGGQPTVIHAALTGSFGYVDSVVMAPAGNRVYALNNQWREHGGGVHGLHIECDGTLTEEGQLLAAQNPSALLFLPGDPSRAVVAADDAASSAAELDAHLFDWTEPPTWVDGVDAFPDDDNIVGSATITPDGQYALLGDNCGFCGVPNRVGVVRVETGGLAGVQVLTPIEDPYAMVASPHGDAVLVVSGFGNALFLLSYDSANSTEPFVNQGEPSYQGGPPQLAGKAVLIDRGSLNGRVLLTEHNGVRQVTFQPGGTLVDHGLSTFGTGVENNVGAIGVQP